MATRRATTKKAPAAPKTARKPIPVPPSASIVVTPPRGRGRPSAFKHEYIELARRLSMLRTYTNEELAGVFGVGITTFKKWMHDSPDFAAAIACAKDFVDAKVVNELFRRAIGYDYEEVQTTTGTEKGKKLNRTTTTKKHLAGDVTAQSLWLRNRQPQHWKAQPIATDIDDSTPAPTHITIGVVDASKPKDGFVDGGSSS